MAPYTTEDVPTLKTLSCMTASFLVFLCIAFVSTANAAPVEGFVYNARTAKPISGVHLVLLYDDSDASEPGEIVPAQRLPVGQQNQRSAADGSYSFDMPEGRAYRIQITSDADRFSFPAQEVAPQSGFPRSGDVAPNDKPRSFGPRPFYLRFDTTINNGRFLNNHIALDRSSDVVSLSLQSDRTSASIGDILNFTASLENQSSRDFVTAKGSQMYLRLRLAQGLSVNLSSATSRISRNGELPPEQFAPSIADHGKKDRLLRFGPFDVPAGVTLRFHFQATVGIDTQDGRHKTRLVAVDSGNTSLSPIATASVQIDADATLTMSTLLGRVYCDRNQNSRQDKQEPGVFGATIYSDTGAIATSDPDGKFHFTRLRAGSHVIKLDTASLAGDATYGSNTRLLRLTEGLPAQVNFPVQCKRKWVGASEARIVYPLLPSSEVEKHLAAKKKQELPKERMVTMRGRIQPMTLEIDGQRFDLPTLHLKPQFPLSRIASVAPALPQLHSIPPKGFANQMPRWRATWKPAVLGPISSWTFSIENYSEGEHRTIYSKSGTGAPSPIVEWDGLTSAGASTPDGTYSAQMLLFGQRGVEVSNRRSFFGIGMSPAISSQSTTSKKELRVNGRLVSIDDDGGFQTRVPVNKEGVLELDIAAPTGRYAGFQARIHKNTSDLSQQQRDQSRTWVVRGDLAKQSLLVDFAPFPIGLWSLSARLRPASATTPKMEIPEIKTIISPSGRLLTAPLSFSIAGLNDIDLHSWKFVIADTAGAVVYKQVADGKAPQSLQWDGTQDGALSLENNTRYQYWIEAEFSPQLRAKSKPAWFVVAPKRSAVYANKRGRYFSANASLKASLRNLLSTFANKAKREPGAFFVLSIFTKVDANNAEAIITKTNTYLKRLGMKPSSFSVRVLAHEDDNDRVQIVKSAPLVASSPQIRINDRVVAMMNTQFDESIELSNASPLVVQVRTLDGVSLRYIGVNPPPAIAPKPESSPLEEVALRDDEILAKDTPAKHLRVKLPRRGFVLSNTQLAIAGSLAANSELHINGTSVPIATNGKFHVLITLPLGMSDLNIRADDTLGGSSTIVWPVEVADSHTFALGMLEGLAVTGLTSNGLSAEGASLPGMTANSTLQIGSTLLGLRARGYLKSRFSGGSFSDTVEITAHIDTGKAQGSQAFFESLSQEKDGLALYGDSASELQDVNTRGPVYARIVAGESSATLGSIVARLEGGGELFRYQRTADGLTGELRRTALDSDFSVRAFSTTGSTSSSRDINWFRATGGTLFYLKHGHILQGSEKLRVVIRSRDSGVRLSEEDLVEGVDYSVDYQGGRIRLTAPLSMVHRSSWVLDNLDSSATPMSGNLVYLRVQYEHEDQDGLGQQARGAYAATTIEGRLSIGAGIVDEERDAASPYRLLGADVSYNLGEHSNLRAEVAGSKQADANHFMSLDGGLSFGRLQNHSSFGAGPTDSYRIGWKLSADLAAKDWSDATEFSETNLSLYVQDLDQGFASEDSVLDQGRFKFGARLQHKLSPRDTLFFRHEGQLSLLPRVGPTLGDVMANPQPEHYDQRASYLTSLQWARKSDRWQYKLEGLFQKITSTAVLESDAPALDASRLGVGANAEYELSPRTTLHIGQQFLSILSLSDPVLNPIDATNTQQRQAQPLAGVVSNVGGEFKLAPDLSVGLDLYQRWNGDNAVRVGLRTALSEQGSMYVQEQVGGSNGRLRNVTIIGAEDRFGEDGGGRSYGEYQIDSGVLGNRNRAVMGLGRRWQLSKVLGVGMGFEAQQAFGGHLSDGTPIGNSRRHVLHSAFSLQPNQRFRLVAQAELRFDHGDSSSRVDPRVLGQDPRAGILGTFSNHGGPAPGAALVIAPGEQTQLVAGLAADWIVSPRSTLMARTRGSLSEQDPPGGSPVGLAHFAELTGAWSFRPLRSDRFELLSRYSYLLEKRPVSVENTRATESRSQVLALMQFARLPNHFLLSGKLALKRTQSLVEIERGGSVQTTLSAVLAIVRLGYQFYGNWDASAELRQLSLFGSANSESKIGTLLEVGYNLGQHLHLGMGYNLSHFSDNELADLQRDSHGLFVRITGYY